MFHWIGLREKQLPEGPEELIFVTAWFPIFSDLQIFIVSICIHPVNVEVLFWSWVFQLHGYSFYVVSIFAMTSRQKIEDTPSG